MNELRITFSTVEFGEVTIPVKRNTDETDHALEERTLAAKWDYLITNGYTLNREQPQTLKYHQ